MKQIIEKVSFEMGWVGRKEREAKRSKKVNEKFSSNESVGRGAKKFTFWSLLCHRLTKLQVPPLLWILVFSYVQWERVGT